MDSGSYDAALSLMRALEAQEVHAHNLANVNTPGFKRRLAVSQPFDQHLAEASAQLSEQIAQDVVVDFRHGALQSTGNPLDLALEGDGFFVIEGPNGPLYTRHGVFTLDAQRRIVDSVGRPLQGDAGPLTVPPDGSAIAVASDGTVSVDGNAIGRVRVVDVPAPRAMQPVGGSAFAVTGGVTPQRVETPVVRQGAVEQSNANAIDEMVSMIATLRNFEAAQRALRQMSEITEQLTQAAQTS